MKKITLTLALLWIFTFPAISQIINGLDTLYGNEWIDFDQDYFKIMLAEDGIYELPYQSLVDAGVPISQIDGAEFQLFHNGEEIPIYTTTEGTFGAADRIEFYGKKNTSELDRHLFKNPEEEMMNPRYSLFTDTSAYFLTWTETGAPLRYEEIANDLTNLPAKEEFYMAELLLNQFSQHQKEGNSEGVRLSSFTMGEGFASSAVNVQMHTLTPSLPFIGGPAANLNIRYSGTFGQHEQLITLNGTTLMSDVFSGFEVRQHEFSVANADLAGPLEVKFQGMVSNNDRQRVANIVLNYPKLFNANNMSSMNFSVEESGSKKYVEITDFDFSGGQSIVYDILNGQRIIASESGGVVKIAMPGINEKRNIWAINSNTGLKNIASIVPVDFIDYSEVTGNFIFLSNPRLYDDGSGNNYVQEYADYRASNDGGNFETVIVDVQQVYEQFGWGLNRHSLSVRNFAHFVNKEWEDVEYFFIVGKGREYNGVRTNAQLTSSNNETFYVPTFGTPGSDNLLMSTNQSSAPIIPIGRLAASTPKNVQTFLKKMVDFETNESAGQTIEERQWMKNIIHLGGGNAVSEQTLIKNHLLSMENIVENNLFGAEVSSFYKSSSDPIQTSTSEQVFARINSGVSIITFFGHAAVGTFDINIDNPDNYENFKKYPVLFSLGCFSGNIHTSGLGISERFIFQEDKAALSMVATSGYGYISSLYSVMSKFYENIGGDYYQESMGVLLQKTIEHFDETNSNQVLLQQFTYHGDPAMRIFSADGPDFLIDPTSVDILPKNINIRQDSFTVEFSVVNIGKNTEDSIHINIEHELPNGDRFTVVNLHTKSPAYATPFQVRIPTVGKVAVGSNRIYITVDGADIVEELPFPEAELNNGLVEESGQEGVRFFITDNGATPVYPSDFAIVGETSLVLRASTSDALAPLNKYIIEIDTTKLFNSPLRINRVIEQTGGLIEWEPDIAFEDERVYYWRISPDSISPDLGYAWENRSFTYIAGSGGGWSQRHYWQFLQDRSNFLSMNENSKKFEFSENFIDFRVRNKLYNASDPPNGFVNGVKWSDFFRWQLYESLTIVVFDTLGQIWLNWNPGEYGSVNTNAARIGAYPFPVETIDQRADIIDFINNVIPDDHCVVVYPVRRTLINDLNIADWEADSITLGGLNLFNVLEAQGAQHVRDLKNELVPYCFAFKKNQGSILEELASNSEGEVNAEISIAGVWHEGRVLSTVIGPASEWESFTWSYDDSGIIDQDSFYVDIYGFDSEEVNDILLFDNYSESSINLDGIDVDSFPYLRLEFYAKDSIERSPVQLKDWNILYKGYPDVAFNSAENFLFHNDTLPEGDNLIFESYVANSNNIAMDSLLVQYEIRDKAGIVIQQENRVSSIEADGELNLTFSYSTENLSGDHEFIVELNPDDDQSELFQFNNYLIKDFYVMRDRENPILDVTFDGIRILDGDIVSPKPEVSIRLKDENEFLLLDDTSAFNLYLVMPNEQLESIPLNSPSIFFTPAVTGTQNQSILQWNPTFNEAGQYSLIVQAKDPTGNNAGAYDYKVSFEVILENSLSNILTYPNPFSTATRFVYTLTGEPPALFKIQIMTISGRIVREVQQDELGELKIGTHQTDFVWDGTDEFGDKLANGVYLYRVLAKNQMNEEYKLFETGADGFFQEGYGKVVIVR